MNKSVSILESSLLGRTGRAMAFALICAVYGNALALPALQIGPDPDNPDHWTYDMTEDTWVTSMTNFNLLTLANSNGPGARGAYAWDALGSLNTNQWAYLVVAATPKAADNTDLFDVSLMNDGVSLTMVDSGFGNPPLEDTNSMSPHGIFETYFELWEFQFDKSPVTIGNTEPGDDSTGEGYSEIINVQINSLMNGVLGLHFDLFTLTGSGKYSDIAGTLSKDVLKANAPYSHDAEFVSVIPVPAAFWLFGTALIGFIGISRRRSV